MKIHKETMDQLEIREKYYKAIDTIKELKKQNNSLQEMNKKLKTKMRWPEHLRAAVQNKELIESHKLLQSKAMELNKQCSVYEREIAILKAQLNMENPGLKTTPRNDSTRERPETEDRSPSLQVSIERTMQEMREKEALYKNQLEEARERLQATEERLAQVLRLRTMDSAELFRISRANKIMAAEVTTLQDENDHLNMAVEEAQARMNELAQHITREQKRRNELQEEIAQAQLTEQAMQDVNQELEDVKKECDMLRNRMKAMLAEALESAAKINTSEEEMSAKLAKLQITLTEQTATLQHVSLQLETHKQMEREFISTQKKLLAENAELKNMLGKKGEVAPSTVQTKVNVTEQGTQTVDMEDLAKEFKPPDVAHGLTPEESDLILSQMHVEIESHRELVRTQTHLTNLFKGEMESLREQLQKERAQYAAELAEKMAKIQDMQTMLSQQCFIEEQKFVSSLGSSNKSTPQKVMSPINSPPVPAPRNSVSNKKTEKSPPQSLQAPEINIQALEIYIQSLSATDKSVLLDAEGSGRLFLEFNLSDDKSFETPGNFPRPTAVKKPVPINHTHCWHADGSVELSKLKRLHFSVVGDQEDDAEEDCTDFGTAEVPLEDFWDSLLSQGPDTMINLEVPILNEDKLILGHLHIALRHTKP